MRPDELDTHEQSAQEIIHAIGRASAEVRVPSHFAAGVMAKAAASKKRRRTLWHVAARLLPWMPAGKLRFAVAFTFVIAVVGAIPQYATWFKAFTAGVPSTVLHAALEQEQLWQKNFACATRLDQNSADYAAITGDKVHVVVWACPSGDVLVTTESPLEAALPRSTWVPLARPASEEGRWTPLVQEAFAAGRRRPDGLRLARIVNVLCQRWLRDSRILRRVRLDNGSCRDEVINTRTGQVVQSRPAPCDPQC